MYPNELQELKVTIISNERCEKLIPFYITATNICFRASGAGTCTVWGLLVPQNYNDSTRVHKELSFCSGAPLAHWVLSC